MQRKGATKCHDVSTKALNNNRQIKMDITIKLTTTKLDRASLASLQFHIILTIIKCLTFVEEKRR